MRTIIPLLCAISAHAQFMGVSQRKIVATGPACTPMTGYAHCRGLTIDHTQVGGSTLTNFPVLVAATLGSSKLQNASCFDKVYTSNSGGTTLIPWEIESCNQGTGAIVDWVLCASCSSSADTVLYVSYGNSGISTAQNTGANGPAHVWDSNFVTVLHLAAVAGNVSGLDSTSNANNGAVTSTSTTPGQIAGGARFAAANSSTIANTSTSGMPVGSNAAFTLSMWIKAPAAAWLDVFGGFGGTGNPRAIFAYGGGGGNDVNLWDGSGNYDLGVTYTGSWELITFTYGSTTLTGYINGLVVSTPQTHGFNNGLQQYALNISHWHSATFAGDEFRISTVARAAGWVLAEYNNQKASSTFVTVGSEV
jgi:hypothetical protein